jgi:hypothetical protein
LQKQVSLAVSYLPASQEIIITLDLIIKAEVYYSLYYKIMEIYQKSQGLLKKKKS